MFIRSKLTHLFLAIIALSFISALIPGIAAPGSGRSSRSSSAESVTSKGRFHFSRPGTEDWAAAEMNRPITIGDKLWADQDSLVEVGPGLRSHPARQQHRVHHPESG